MKMSRHIAGAFVQIEKKHGEAVYKISINGASKGVFHLGNQQGVLALIEICLKVNPGQKEMKV